jgi:hypothetical protein
MKPNFSKIRTIYLTRKTKVLNYQTDLEIRLYCEQTVLRIWVYMLIANFIFIIKLIYFFLVQLNYKG